MPEPITIVIDDKIYKTLNIDDLTHNSYGTHLAFRQIGNRKLTSIQTISQIVITIPAKT